ncbi:MAG TPA: c-type cytochrome [Candidatus Acidoferrum sp.]|nr:c-type cytochrome [Candidatus Acidoferrum sp.]
MNRNIVLSALLLAVFATGARDRQAANKVPAETAAVASGKRTYLEYCAACHGADGRGMGPAAPALNTPPTDLTTLARRHGGKFPEDYVVEILRFGKPVTAHGSADMPVWGPIFGVRDNGNEVAVRRRIKNLCDYLVTLQEHES